MNLTEYKMMFSKRPRVKHRHLEDDLQMVCVQWFCLRWPKRLIWAIPNGGKRNPREAARLKRMGVKPGVPDLEIPEPMRGYHGLYVELKSEDNQPTKNQDEVIGQLRQRGYAVEVCRSLKEFQIMTRLYLEGRIDGN